MRHGVDQQRRIALHLVQLFVYDLQGMHHRLSPLFFSHRKIVAHCLSERLRDRLAPTWITVSFGGSKAIISFGAA
jgi:hypothetical protein